MVSMFVRTYIYVDVAFKLSTDYTQETDYQCQNYLQGIFFGFSKRLEFKRGGCRSTVLLLLSQF